MTEKKGVDYYLELLKKKGLKSDEFNGIRFSPSYENQYFPDEKIFMTWLIEWDYSEFKTNGEQLFSVYSNPSSEDNIVINKYLKENNKNEEISNLIDRCTEGSLYTLSILMSVNKYNVDELIDIHNKTFKDVLTIREKIYDIVNGALESFRKTTNKNKDEHYIG